MFFSRKKEFIIPDKVQHIRPADIVISRNSNTLSKRMRLIAERTLRSWPILLGVIFIVGCIVAIAFTVRLE